MTGLSGVLLVGGASTRFGSPKALARFRGETLAERAWRVLGEACDERLAVGKAGELELPFPVLDDGSELRAPIVGVLAGLRAAAHETVVFLPVDCPLVTPELLRALGEARAVPQTGPLPGAYSEGRSARARAPRRRRRALAARRQSDRPGARPATAREREHAGRSVSARTAPRRSRRAAAPPRRRLVAARRARSGRRPRRRRPPSPAGRGGSCARRGRRRARRARPRARLRSMRSRRPSSTSSTSSRSRTRPSIVRSDAGATFASSGSCSRVWFTFSPIPSTTTPSFASARIPATLRRARRTSFGHLICAESPVASSTASATATAATRESSCARRSAGGRSSTETMTEVPGASTQLRPSRPRPAVWWSVVAIAPSGSSGPRKRLRRLALRLVAPRGSPIKRLPAAPPRPCTRACRSAGRRRHG